MKIIDDTKIIYITILVVMIGVLIYVITQQVTQQICEWKITNCCPENAGAQWECVKTKDFKQPYCSGLILCPQVVSPKPSMSCVNVNGVCVVK
jgi:hypothetical protein